MRGSLEEARILTFFWYHALYCLLTIIVSRWASVKCSRGLLRDSELKTYTGLGSHANYSRGDLLVLVRRHTA